MDARGVAIRLRDLAELIGARPVGEADLMINGVAGVAEAGPGQVTFIAAPKYAPYLENTRAAAVILPAENPNLPLAQLVAENPRVAFARVMAYFYPEQAGFEGVSPQAWVHPEARVGEDSVVYPLAFVGRGAVLGRRVVLYPGVCLGEDVEVGDDSVLFANVSVYSGTRLGCRVRVHAGAVLGSDGFGYAPDGERYHKITHAGRVVVEDDVEIGAGTTVDRAVIGETRIGAGTKLDNLVQVAHNVVIGRHTVVASQTGISGSTVVGSHVQMGGQVGLVDHITIGDGVRIGAQSGVPNDVPVGETVSGSPPLPHREWLRVVAVWRNLPRLQARVKALEKELEELRRERASQRES